jgi:hypothetical protein
MMIDDAVRTCPYPYLKCIVIEFMMSRKKNLMYYERKKGRMESEEEKFNKDY